MDQTNFLTMFSIMKNIDSSSSIYSVFSVSLVPIITKKLSEIKYDDIIKNIMKYIMLYYNFLYNKKEYKIYIHRDQKSVNGVKHGYDCLSTCLAIDHYISINNIKLDESTIVDNNNYKIKNISFNKYIQLTTDINLYIKANITYNYNQLYDNSGNEYILSGPDYSKLLDFIEKAKDTHNNFMKIKDSKLYFYKCFYDNTKDIQDRNEISNNKNEVSKKEENDDRNEVSKDEKKKKEKIICKGSFKYVQYLLVNNKSLKSLFFKDKNKIVENIINFKNKTGIYSKEGISHKLGFLLYGPPGTGKTSFIKALSNEFQRNIISIPIGSIKTNKQFFDLIISKDKEFKIMEYEDIIYVIEDLDAIQSIIIDRSILNDFEKSNSIEYEDALNLSEILNVLDGIIDTPGRMIVFTTNHIDHIDPALIRPGRIDILLKMDYLTFDIAVDMLNYYYSNFNINIYQDNLKIFIETKSISPATLEQYIKLHYNDDTGSELMSYIITV